MASVAAEPRPTGGRPDVGRLGRRPLLGVLGVAALTVAVDQLTKWWALEALTQPTRIVDLVWTLRLRVVYNTGTAFSLTSDSGPYVTVIALGVVGYLLWTARQQRSTPVLVCMGAIVGGTVGNLLDRALRDGDGFLGGPVIDFVDLQWFPVWNVADAALVLGILALVVLGVGTDEVVVDDAPPADQPTGDRPTGDETARP